MTIVVAVLLTAVLVGAAATILAQRSTSVAINDAIGGRAGADPVDEHRRLLSDEQQLAASATARLELLELSLDALSSGVIVTDRAGAVLARSRLATDVATRLHEQTLVDAATTELLALAVDGEPAEREIEVFGPPRRVLFLHAVPISAQGEVVGALVVLDDVTDAHRIDSTRRDFVANLSHELRTPVGAISLLTEMLIDEESAATRSQLTDRLLVETERMSTTIDDLLELSRIESETQLYNESVDVQLVVAEAMARCRVVAESRGIEVGVIAPAESIVMLGNRDQLLSATTNLLENAVKYSEPGDSVSVRVRVDDGVLLLSVQDTGRGIPVRDVDRVFERFYRVDRSRDTATGGTGIGLSIVRHTALNHGGTATVSSFEGEGSTFTLTLPMRSTTDTSPVASNPAEPTSYEAK